jgi:hypothetical protein
VLAAALAGPVAAAGCGRETPADLASEPLAATRIEPDTAIAEPLAAVGGTLLARAPTDEAIGETVPDTLLRSVDGGRTWDQVALPDRPEGVAFGPTSPLVTGDVAVVVGRGIVPALGMTVDAGDAYVWTSADGETWRGARLTGAGPAFDQPEVHAVGGVLLATVQTGDIDLLAPHRLEVFRSADGGGTWEPVALPDLGPTAGGTMSPGTPVADGGRLLLPIWPGGNAKQRLLVSPDDGVTWSLEECPQDPFCLDETVGDLAVRAVDEHGDGVVTHEVSVDGGPWQPVEVDPPLPFPDGWFGDVVALPAGGWLATVSWDELEDSSSSQEGLLRSDDGVHWAAADAPPPCELRARELDAEGFFIPLPDVSVHTPVGFAGQGVVAYACDDGAQLWAVPEGGAAPGTVEGSARAGVSYGPPVVAGDVLVVPERADGGDGRVTALLHVVPEE